MSHVRDVGLRGSALLNFRDRTKCGRHSRVEFSVIRVCKRLFGLFVALRIDLS